MISPVAAPSATEVDAPEAALGGWHQLDAHAELVRRALRAANLRVDTGHGFAAQLRFRMRDAFFHDRAHAPRLGDWNADWEASGCGDDVRIDARQEARLDQPAAHNAYGKR